MDYLLRDSYFSGVKYGIYDYGRLLMSFIPVMRDDSVYLAYKESGMDSILEFTNARSSLYSQVYFHKTNRALSAMLNKACRIAKLQNVIELKNGNDIINNMQDFYVNNSDQSFLASLLEKTKGNSANDIIRDVMKREVWKKIYERKHTFSNIDLFDEKCEILKEELTKEINSVLENEKLGDEWTLDFQMENNFKDIDKSEAIILKKKTVNDYDAIRLSEYGDVLNSYHHIKFFIRVFVSQKTKEALGERINHIYSFIDEIVNKGIGSINSNT